MLMVMTMKVRLCCQMANGSASEWLTEVGARKRGSLNWFQFFSYLLSDFNISSESDVKKIEKA